MEPARKKGKKDESATAKSMVVRFVAAQQADSEVPQKAVALPQLDVPLDATTLQLERLVNELLGNQERAPFAFYVTEEKKEVVGALKDAVREHDLSTEAVLEIKYEALSLFRVHPVTRCTDSMPGHTEALLHVRFSPDGTQLASGGGDTTVRFWNVSSRTPRFVCKGHRNHVLCTAWSPDGQRFASGDKNGEIRLWDPSTGKLVGRPFVGHKQWVTSLSWEPQHANGGRCERLLSGSKDKTARVWNARTGRCEMTLTGHQDSVESVSWGGEGLLYTASRDKNIQVWTQRGPAESGAATAPFKLVRVLAGHAHRINSLALSTDYLCRTGALDHTGKFYTEESAKLPPGTGAATPESQKAPYDREGAYAAACKRYAAAKAAHAGSSDAPFERLVSCSDDLTIYLWHPTESKQPVQRLMGHQQPVTHLNFSPDGRYLASASFDKKVKLWCGRTGRFMATLTGHVGHVYQVCWAPDSRLLCSASKDSTLKVWEARNPRRPRETLGGHLDEVYALDWSPNGELLASGGKDRVLKIWTS